MFDLPDLVVSDALALIILRVAYSEAMRDTRPMIVSAILGLALFLNLSAYGEKAEEKPRSVSFFDVLDMPARIDEPKLLKINDRYLLKCAIANRSTEPLLGLRLILMIVGSDGKMRKRLNWSEESALPPASINTFELRPPLSDKDKLQTTDRLLLAIDEAIGRETIWRLVDSERIVRAYARGQHDVIPKVRTVANNDDRIGTPQVIPLKLKP